jgi:hypothetical protein
MIKLIIMQSNKVDLIIKLFLTLVIYFIWFLIANRDFDLVICLFNLGLSYMAAVGLYIHCCTLKFQEDKK